MKIIKDYPPNYTLIKTALPAVETTKVIFCYGDIIYNPHDINITPDLEVHEEVHSKQQGRDIEGWWYKYLTDPAFRLSQEVEAYGTQYAFAKKHINNNKMLDWLKEKLAEALSGASYGYLVDYHAAQSLIKKFAKTALIS